MTYPQWATPERRAYMDKLQVLLLSGRCSYGEVLCPVLERFRQAVREKIGEPNAPVWIMRAALATPKVLARFPIADLHHLPPWLAKELEAYWKADDRDKRSYLLKLEKRRMHALSPQITKRGEWDSIRREQYLANREVFEIVAIGISALTFKRVAQVRIPSLKATLWVDLTRIEVNKSKSRKLARYKRGAAPKEMESRIVERCRKAVERCLSHSG